MPLLAMPRDAEIPKIPMFMVTKVGFSTRFIPRQADGEALAKRLLQEPVEVELRWDTVPDLESWKMQGPHADIESTFPPLSRSRPIHFLQDLDEHLRADS